jgi:ADP-ribose pyrophosphatase
MIVRETFREPTSGARQTRAVIRHPGVVVVVALAGPDEILLVRQYRHPVGARVWEVPAGTLSGRDGDGVVVTDERPAECAARELEEETGWVAGRIEPIGMCYPMPGGSDERIHVFVARDLRRGTQALDPGEAISDVRAVAVRDVLRMIATGEIVDGKTVSAMLYALNAGVVSASALAAVPR